MIKSKEYITAREMRILSMRGYQKEDSFIIRMMKAIFSFIVLILVIIAVITLSVKFVPINSIEKVMALFVIVLAIFTYYVNIFLPKYLNIVD